MIDTCLICGKKRKLSSEHIIPQCLGSALKKKIYCINCNSGLGEELDVDLANHFGRYATILRVERDRGENQPFTIEDENTGLSLKFDGYKFSRTHPVINKKESKEGNLEEVEVIARSPEELNRIFGGIAKKHNIDLGLVVYDEIDYPPPSTAHEFVLDTDILHKAIAKIAYGFACWKLPKNIILSESFTNIREYILGERNGCLVSSNYEHTDFMTDNRRPLHKVHISFNRAQGLVIGYVTLFGAFRYTVLLSDNYSGYIEWSGIDYTFNPVTQREVFANPIFRAPKLTVKQVVKPKKDPAKINQSLQHGLSIIAEYSDGSLRDVSVEKIKA